MIEVHTTYRFDAVKHDDGYIAYAISCPRCLARNDPEPGASGAVKAIDWMTSHQCNPEAGEPK